LKPHVRSATVADTSAWLHMRCALWPEGSEAEHRSEIDQFFAGQLRDPLEVLLATTASGEAIGFAELSIRAYAEDCVTDRVAYLEGWYVAPEARRQGVGRALVSAAEKWAVVQGCTEFASDALIDNDVSAAAHRALGFAETVQLRCFRKALVLVLLLVSAACSEWPIGARELPGTYVMNRGRAADTLILDRQGHFRRIYAMPDKPVVIDSGRWTVDTFHETVYVAFATFSQRWRAESDMGALPRYPIAAGPWRAPPERGFSGQIRLPVDPDLDWVYTQRRRGR
jgi:aminoglycoside 6'-N-acetyltransferase I